MATAEFLSASPLETVADLIERLGGIPPQRLLLHPPPGTATEADLLAARNALEGHICELVEGTLVEKPMATPESNLAGRLQTFLNLYLEEFELGTTFGEAGALRLLPGLVRIPDVSFVSWAQLGGEIPKVPIISAFPELAVEVISEGNTAKEMKRKMGEYFARGTRQVWLIYPKTQTAEIYLSPSKKRRIGKDGVLDGGDLLPGFSLSLKKLFAHYNRRK